MDTLDIALKIALPVIGALLVTLIVYLFRMRQLYLSLPAIFAYNELTNKGNTFNLSVYNRSRKSEDEIRVELDPAIAYSVIASSHTGISLEKNVLFIPRLPAKSSVSVIMLAEGANFNESRISQISSKEHKGEILGRYGVIPPNWADVAMKITVIFLSMSALVWGTAAYDKRPYRNLAEEQKIVTNQLKHLENEGWSDYESYAFSNLRKSYLDQELPVSVVSEKFKNGLYEATISATNKTAILLYVNAGYYSTENFDVTCLPTKEARNLKVEPGQTITFKISIQLPRDKPRIALPIGFDFFFGKERRITLSYTRPVR